MQQRKATGRARSRWPYTVAKCHFCRRTFKEGEEMIALGGVSVSEVVREMHRSCLDDWLTKHPPIPGGGAAKKKTDEELEKEFQRLQRNLRAKIRREKTRSQDS